MMMMTTTTIFQSSLGRHGLVISSLLLLLLASTIIISAEPWDFDGNDPIKIILPQQDSMVTNTAKIDATNFVISSDIPVSLLRVPYAKYELCTSHHPLSGTTRRILIKTNCDTLLTQNGDVAILTPEGNAVVPQIAIQNGMNMEDGVNADVDATITISLQQPSSDAATATATTAVASFDDSFLPPSTFGSHSKAGECVLTQDEPTTTTTTTTTTTNEFPPKDFFEYPLVRLTVQLFHGANGTTSVATTQQYDIMETEKILSSVTCPLNQFVASHLQSKLVIVDDLEEEEEEEESNNTTTTTVVVQTKLVDVTLDIPSNDDSIIVHANILAVYTHQNNTDNEEEEEEEDETTTPFLQIPTPDIFEALKFNDTELEALLQDFQKQQQVAWLVLAQNVAVSMETVVGNYSNDDSSSSWVMDYLDDASADDDTTADGNNNNNNNDITAVGADLAEGCPSSPVAVGKEEAATATQGNNNENLFNNNNNNATTSNIFDTTVEEDNNNNNNNDQATDETTTSTTTTSPTAAAQDSDNENDDEENDDDTATLSPTLAETMTTTGSSSGGGGGGGDDDEEDNNTDSPTATDNTKPAVANLENTSSSADSNNHRWALWTAILTVVWTTTVLILGHCQFAMPMARNNNNGRLVAAFIMVTTTAVLLAFLAVAASYSSETTISRAVPRNGVPDPSRRPRAASPRHRHLEDSGNNGDDDDPLTIPAAGSSCHIVAEILMDGSTMGGGGVAYIQAPALRVINTFPERLDNSNTSNTDTSLESNNNTSLYPPLCEYAFKFNESLQLLPDDAGAWDIEPWTSEQDGGLLGYSVNPAGCAVPGRPFRDSSGQMVMGKIIDTTVHVPLSNLGVSMAEDISIKSNFGPAKSDNQGASDNDDSHESFTSLAKTWRLRALGEHASIASFAAFTIQLMTHGAPLGLIDESLVAAQDEVRHAQDAFEIANLLEGMTAAGNAFTNTSESQEQVLLPPSQHQFDKNLTALAIATVEEGCVDETLSALELAAMADDLSVKNSMHDDDNWRRIVEKIHRMAQDEGRHSMLAWKTIQWVCRKDPANACAAALSKLSDRQDETKRRFRFSSWKEEIQSSWSRLYSMLVPHLRNSPVTENWNSESELQKTSSDVPCCLSYNGKEGEEGKKCQARVSMIEVLMHQIVDGVTQTR